MKEEIKTLNTRFDCVEDRFDHLEGIIIHLIELANATNQKVDKLDERLERVVSELKITKLELPKRIG
jgi:tetrahydromethanopterin S-methyltransferase subunit G